MRTLRLTYGLLLILSLAGFSASAQSHGWDYRVLKGIQEHRTPFLDKTMDVVSASLVLAPAAPVAQLLFDNSQPRWPYALESATSLGATACITTVTKYAVGRPRPYVAYEGDLMPVHTTHGFSFPSGHTSLAFATATSLSLEYARWYVAVPSLLWASAVGFSRLYLGVHYPSDVLTGALLGISLGCATHFFYQRLREQALLPEVKGLVIPIVITF